MTDAPLRIWLHWRPGMAVTNGPLTEHPDYTGYIMHTREALAQSPIVQEIVAEAVRQALGITKPLAAELLQWVDDELGRWPTDTAYADDLARFAAAIRARGEG